MSQSASKLRPRRAEVLHTNQLRKVFVEVFERALAEAQAS